VIRFSAVLVAAAIGVLIGGIATSKLLLVYVAIGLSAAALVALAIGVVLKREELFSEQGQALAPAAAGAGADEALPAGKTSTLPNGAVDPPDTSLPAGAVATFGQAGRGAERPGQDRSGQPAFGQPAYGQAALPAREAPPGRDWSGMMARQPSPPQPERRADEPLPGRDAPAPGRYARPFRSGDPWPPAAPAAASAPPAPAASAAPPAAPAPPAVPVSPWRERPSPTHGDAIGSRAPAPPVGSPPHAPGWPPGPSWFDQPAGPRDAGDEAPKPAGTPDSGSAAASDSVATSGRPEAPAGPELSDADEDVTAEGATPKDVIPEEVTPEDVTPEDVTPEATVPEATVPEAGTTPRADAARANADAARAGTPDATHAAEPAPGADAATDGADAGEAGANDAGSSEGSPKQVTVIPGVPRYHDENCILIRFMADDDVQKTTVQEATEAGCTPCRACQPDTEAN
jgi:hypothetical protein